MDKSWNPKSPPSENWDADFLFQRPAKPSNGARRPSSSTARLTSSAPNSSLAPDGRASPNSPALSFANSALWDDDEDLVTKTVEIPGGLGGHQDVGGGGLSMRDSVGKGKGVAGARIVSDQGRQGDSSGRRAMTNPTLPGLPPSTSLPSRLPLGAPHPSPARQSSGNSNNSQQSSENDESLAFGGSRIAAGEHEWKGNAPHLSSGNGSGVGKRLRKKSRPDPIVSPNAGSVFDMGSNPRDPFARMGAPQTAPLPSPRAKVFGHAKKNSLTGRASTGPFSPTIRQEEPYQPSYPAEPVSGVLSRMSRSLKRLSSSSGFAVSTAPPPPPVPPPPKHYPRPSITAQSDQVTARTIKPTHQPRQSSSRPPYMATPSSSSPPRPIPTRTSSHYSSSNEAAGATLPIPQVLSESPMISSEDGIGEIPLAPRRLATSPSISSLGFHLPSPSPSSAYHPMHAAQFGSQGSLTGILQGSSPPKSQGIIRNSQLSLERTRYDMAELGPKESPSPVSILSSRGSTNSTSPEGKSNRDVAKSLQTFKFGMSRPQSTIESKHDGRKDLSRQSTRESTGSSEQERKKSTLKRLTSLSKKDGRKVSDGWKYVSGGSQPPSMDSAKTTDESLTHRTPKAKHPHILLPPVTASPSPSELLVAPAQSSGKRLIVGPRSSSHNGATTTPDPGSPRETDSRSSVAGRRSSMNDLRIPERVVSAQRSLKEGITQVKQFAEGIHELQALLQQRSLLELSLIKTRDEDIALESPFEPRHDRRATSPVSLNLRKLQDEYSQWWEMAVVLIELGNTGYVEEPDQSIEDQKRSRRVTLAASPESGKLHVETTAHMSPPLASPPEYWRASTGRQDLSQRQLNVLKEMLATPLGGGREDPTPPLQSAAKSNESFQAVRPQARFSHKTHPSEIPLPAPQDTFHNGHARDTRRRQSRSGFFGLKELWRGAQSDRNGGVIEPGEDWEQQEVTAGGYARKSNKSSRRPSLASIFRKTSSSLGSATTESRKSSAQSHQTALTSSPSVGSVRSSLSDWDSIEMPVGTDSSAQNSPASNPGARRNPSFSFNRTPTNSRPDLRRRASASRNLGVGLPGSGLPYDATIRKSSANSFNQLLSGMPAEDEPVAEKAPEQEGSSGRSTEVLALTPETLPGLLKYLQAVAGKCKDNLKELEVIKKSLQT